MIINDHALLEKIRRMMEFSSKISVVDASWLLQCSTLKVFSEWSAKCVGEGHAWEVSGEW